MRVADRDDELADAQLAASPSSARLEVVRVDAQHGEVGERVGADDVEAQLAAVDERRARRRARRSTTWAEVSRKPSGVMTTPLPAPGHVRPPRRAGDTKVRDRRRQVLGDAGDGARVRVERLAVTRHRAAG